MLNAYILFAIQIESFRMAELSVFASVGMVQFGFIPFRFVPFDMSIGG